MLFEETSRYPLINSISDVFNQFAYSCLISLLSSLDSFEEEFDETFKRVLIHMINNTEGNT